MARSDVVDSLIATYRELNLALRPLGDDVLTASGANGSVLDVLKDMRTREILASQQMKAMLVAEAAGTAPDPVDASLIEDPQKVSGRILLSEFGTARESILATALQRSQEDLDKEIAPGANPASMSALLDSLVAQDKLDRARIERIRSGA